MSEAGESRGVQREHAPEPSEERAEGGKGNSRRLRGQEGKEPGKYND